MVNDRDWKNTTSPRIIFLYMLHLQYKYILTILKYFQACIILISAPMECLLIASVLTRGTFLLLYLKSHCNWILSSELSVPKFRCNIPASVKTNGSNAVGLFLCVCLTWGITILHAIMSIFFNVYTAASFFKCLLM